MNTSTELRGFSGEGLVKKVGVLTILVLLVGITGAAAESQVKYGFETGDLSNWTGATSSFSVTSFSYEGSFGVESDSSGSIIANLDSVQKPTTVSTAFASGDTSKNNIAFFHPENDAGGADAFWIRIRSGEIGSSICSVGYSVSSNTYYNVQVKNIDWSSQTAGVYVDGQFQCSGSINNGLGIKSVNYDPNSGQLNADSFLIDWNSKPALQSTSITPDPPLVGENASYGFQGSDSDGNITEGNLTVFKDGSQVFQDSQSFSSSSVDYTWSDVYSPDSEGDLDAKFELTDDAGATTTEWLNRTLSETAPGVEINQPVNQVYSSQTVDWNVSTFVDDSYPDENLEVRIYNDNQLQEILNGTEDETFTGSFSTSDGSHTFKVEVEEADGDTTTETVSYSVDTQPPELNITHPTGKLDIKQNIDLEYDVSDPNLDSCKYNIDGGTNITLANCENTTFSVNNVGSHTINLWASDTLNHTAKEVQEFTADHLNTVQVEDADTSSSIQDFQVVIQNAEGDSIGGSTESGTFEFYTLEMPKGDVNMTLRSDGYQTRTVDVGQVDNSFELSETYNMERAGIYIDALDEQTEEDLQFDFTATNGSVSYNQTNITEFDRDLRNLTEFPTGDVRLTVTHPDDTYRPRQYFLDINENTRTMLTAYLLKRGQGLFTSVEVVDGEQNAIQGALVNIQRLYGTQWKTVVQKETTTSGGQSFYLDPDISYRAYVTHPNYVAFQGTFSPANYQYEPLIIQLGTSDAYNFTTRWDSISYKIEPQTQSLEGEGSQQFNYTVMDSQNDLTEFGLKFWHNGTKVSQDSVKDSPSGGTVSLTEALGNYSDGENVKVEGYFLSDQEYYSVNRTYVIRKGFDQGVFSINAIFYELKQALGETGEAFLALIATFLTVLGTRKTQFTNATMDGALALLVLGIFTWKQMFPGFIFILTLLLLIGVWASRRV